ncbi:MAG: nucleotide exchange factor GrpE [Clostridia bacterium]|nr:nucleotide exchange factor GrpE [Clostridia bacterium]
MEEKETVETELKEEQKPQKDKKKSDKKELEKEIEALKEELAEQNDKYLRMAAEYDNFRRRSREERDSVYENALCDTVSELLPIIDNLERAAMYDDGEKVKEGLLMTAKTTISVFEKMGVEEFGKVGDTFDPNLHNAVLHVEDESLGDSEIVEVFQKGYKKGKHIIRFAMVKVAN